MPTFVRFVEVENAPCFTMTVAGKNQSKLRIEETRQMLADVTTLIAWHNSIFLKFSRAKPSIRYSFCST